MGEEDFYTAADDDMFYLNAAQEFLDSAKLKTVFSKGRKFLRFVGNKNIEQCIALDTLPKRWNIYFFDPNKKAEKIDMVSIDEEYERYFNK